MKKKKHDEAAKRNLRNKNEGKEKLRDGEKTTGEELVREVEIKYDEEVEQHISTEATEELTAVENVDYAIEASRTVSIESDIAFSL